MSKLFLNKWLELKDYNAYCAQWFLDIWNLITLANQTSTVINGFKEWYDVLDSHLMDHMTDSDI